MESLFGIPHPLLLLEDSQLTRVNRVTRIVLDPHYLCALPLQVLHVPLATGSAHMDPNIPLDYERKLEKTYWCLVVDSPWSMAFVYTIKHKNTKNTFCQRIVFT